MSVTLEEVKYIARLACLDYTDDEMLAFTEQFNTILRYIEKLNLLNTDDVEPLSHVIELSNVFREDEVQPSISRERALSNAPSASDVFFTVPKVIQNK